jgi:hypothetical protein
MGGGAVSDVPWSIRGIGKIGSTVRSRATAALVGVLRSRGPGDISGHLVVTRDP